MTAGEHDRGYGHEEQSYSPYYGPPDRYEAYPPPDPYGGYPDTYGGRADHPGRYADPYPDGEPEETRGGRRGDREAGRRRGMPLWQELPLLLVIAFCLAVLVRTFLLQAFYIPSGSMEDTLLAGDRVLVNKVVYDVREPARGEVVVFEGTDAWVPQQTADEDIGMFASVGRFLGDLVGISRPGEKDYIKRIVGLPGDRVSCCDVDGRVFVNGQPLDEGYVVHDAPLTDTEEETQDCRTRRFDEVVVEPGQMFVMGDHRAVSQDSRCQGQVPIENIIGRAFVIVWPSSRWEGLPAPATFDTVPSTVQGQVAPGGPAPGGSGIVLPVLAPILAARAMTFHHSAARSRPFGRTRGRRLAE